MGELVLPGGRMWAWGGGKHGVISGRISLGYHVTALLTGVCYLLRCELPSAFRCWSQLGSRAGICQTIIFLHWCTRFSNRSPKWPSFVLLPWLNLSQVATPSSTQRFKKGTENTAFKFSKTCLVVLFVSAVTTPGSLVMETTASMS